MERGKTAIVSYSRRDADRYLADKLSKDEYETWVKKPNLSDYMVVSLSNGLQYNMNMLRGVRLWGFWVDDSAKGHNDLDETIQFIVRHKPVSSAPKKLKRPSGPEGVLGSW